MGSSKAYIAKNKKQMQELAEMYFLKKVVGLSTQEVCNLMNITKPKMATAYSKHVSKIIDNPLDDRYEIFYQYVQRLAEVQNVSFDLAPPIQKIEESSKDNFLKKLSERNSLKEQIKMLDEFIQQKIDFILEDMLQYADQLRTNLADLIDTLTVKQYREKDYPDCFIRKVLVISERIAPLDEKFSKIINEDLITQTSVRKYHEVSNEIDEIKINIKTLDIKNPS